MRTTRGLRPVALAVLVLTALSGCSAAAPAPPAATARASAAPTVAVDAQAAFRELEARYGARLGVLALDTGSDRRVEHRADERFPFASANKLFVAAAELQRSSDAELGEVVRYSSADLLAHAPITRRHVEQGMTVRALIDAACGTATTPRRTCWWRDSVGRPRCSASCAPSATAPPPSTGSSRS